MARPPDMLPVRSPEAWQHRSHSLWLLLQRSMEMQLNHSATLHARNV